MPKFRIRNRYLLQLLAVLLRLGHRDVSAQVLGEGWREQQGQTDDEYFLHLHVLVDYGFIEIHEPQASNSVGFEEMMQQLQPLDSNIPVEPMLSMDFSVSITQDGIDFLERYFQR